ncbi:MAG: fibronectin type III domain-containing protein [Chloroflexi bacterium]|nr:fibronectin type III domain-containing protein [Chloroflexota bacterium]
MKLRPLRCWLARRWLAGRALPDLLAVVVLWLIPVALYWPHLIGQRTIIGNSDRLHTFLNVRLFQVEQLREQGFVPGWTDRMLMGIPIDGLHWIFPLLDPSATLLRLAPPERLLWLAGLVSALHMVLAGLAAYVCLRDQALRPFPAVIGAGLYACSTFSILRVSQVDSAHAVLIVGPLGLWAIRRAAPGQTARAGLLLAALVALLLGFTFLQEAAYTLLWWGAYALFCAVRRRDVRPVAALTVGGLAGGLIASPRLVVALVDLRELARGSTFLDVAPYEALRWLHYGIFGRALSEAHALGNSLNLSEGFQLYTSGFVPPLLLVGALWWAWRARWPCRAAPGNGASTVAAAGEAPVDATQVVRASDAPFFAGWLVLVCAVVLLEPARYLLYLVFFGLDFSHNRIVVTALLPTCALAAAVLQRLCAVGPGAEGRPARARASASGARAGRGTGTRALAVPDRATTVLVGGAVAALCFLLVEPLGELLRVALFGPAVRIELAPELPALLPHALGEVTAVWLLGAGVLGLHGLLAVWVRRGPVRRDVDLDVLSSRPRRGTSGAEGSSSWILGTIPRLHAQARSAPDDAPLGAATDVPQPDGPRCWQLLGSVPAYALGALALLHAVSSATVQLRGPNTETYPTPFAGGDFFTAPASAYHVPSPAALAALAERLETDRYRSIVVSGPDGYPTYDTPSERGHTAFLAQFWRLRLVDGYVGLTRRLADLPWPVTSRTLRAISFPHAETVPWQLLAILNVKYAVIASPSLLFNVPSTPDAGRSEAAPADLTIMENPLPPVPRVFFARRAVPHTWTPHLSDPPSFASLALAQPAPFDATVPCGSSTAGQPGPPCDVTVVLDRNRNARLSWRRLENRDAVPVIDLFIAGETRAADPLRVSTRRTTYTLTGLAPNSMYTVRMRTCLTTGCSPPSPALRVPVGSTLSPAELAGRLPADPLAESWVEGLDAAATFPVDGSPIQAAFRQDRVTVDVEPSDHPRFLVVNELFHPGWRAYAGLQELPIYPTNIVMRGVMVPAGVGRIELRFESFLRSWTAALLVLAGLLALAAGMAALRQLDREPERPAPADAPLATASAAACRPAGAVDR